MQMKQPMSTPDPKDRSLSLRNTTSLLAHESVGLDISRLLTRSWKDRGMHGRRARVATKVLRPRSSKADDGSLKSICGLLNTVIDTGRHVLTDMRLQRSASGCPTVPINILGSYLEALRLERLTHLPVQYTYDSRLGLMIHQVIDLIVSMI